MARTQGVDQVLAGFEGYIKQQTERCVVAMEQVTTALEGWAKAEHSYTDRTSNTTNSIRGFVAEATPQMVRGVLSAGMEYDVFLELARGGKWAFLLPVLERHKGDIEKIIVSALGGRVSSTVTGNAAAGAQYRAFKEARGTAP
jgi:hypothetical protein